MRCSLPGRPRAGCLRCARGGPQGVRSTACPVGCRSRWGAHWALWLLCRVCFVHSVFFAVDCFAGWWRGDVLPTCRVRPLWPSEPTHAGGLTRNFAPTKHYCGRPQGPHPATRRKRGGLVATHPFVRFSRLIVLRQAGHIATTGTTSSCFAREMCDDLRQHVGLWARCSRPGRCTGVGCAAGPGC